MTDEIGTPLGHTPPLSGMERTTLTRLRSRRYKHVLALAGVAQLARACACQAQGRRFDPGHPLSGTRGVRWLDQPRTRPVAPGVVPGMTVGMVSCCCVYSVTRRGCTGCRGR